MTHTTEQEREECHKAYAEEYCPYKGNPDPWAIWQTAWQAARRAPAAPQAAPISDELPQGFISDVLTAAGLVRHGKQCKALADRLGDAIEKIWATSIAQRKAIAAATQPAAPEPVAFAQQECIADLQEALARLIAATELHHRNPLDFANLARYNEAKRHAKQAIGTGDA